MSRVSKEYYELKKKAIVDATLEVCEKKTISSITMQDIINATGLSQGAIYRYYKNIDERVCSKLYNDFLINDELEETTIKLTLTKDDNESLKYIINSIPTDKEFNLNPDKSVNIYNNYEFFRKRVCKIL